MNIYSVASGHYAANAVTVMLIYLCRVFKQIIAGKIMEQGPVIVLSFTAQQIVAIRDSSGKVVEGDPVC